MNTYLDSKSGMFFQKRVVHTQFVIYVFIRIHIKLLRHLFSKYNLLIIEDLNFDVFHHIVNI